MVIHEGGRPAQTDVNGCGITGGAIFNIANELSPDIDVIVSGHSHQAYLCTFGTKLVTSARSNGALITDIDLRIDRATGEIVSKTARNVIVAHDIAKSAAMTALLDHYRPFLAELGQRPIGTISAPFLEAPNEAGESALGDLIADAMLEQTEAATAGGAQVALWNSGGDPRRSGRAARQPCRGSDHRDVCACVRRAAVRQPRGGSHRDRRGPGRDAGHRRLSGFSRRVVSGRSHAPSPGASRSRDHHARWPPNRPRAQIRVTTSDYIWNGGDGVVVESRDAHDAGTDIDLFIGYLAEAFAQPAPECRRTGVAPDKRLAGYAGRHLAVLVQL